MAETRRLAELDAAGKLKAAQVPDGIGDQTAAEVPFTPAGSVEATDVQAAIVELDTDLVAEATTRAAADTALSDSLTTEQVVRADADAALDGRVGAIEGDYVQAAALATKADLVGGVVPDGQLPAGITRDAELAAYVDTAINDLLDGAPGALDTLNELAAAIGDDADFAATVTAALAGKQAAAAELTVLSGLSSTALGRTVLTAASAVAARTALDVYSTAEVDAAVDNATYLSGVVSESEPTNPTPNMVWLKPQLSYDIEGAIGWSELFFASRISGDEGDLVAQWDDQAGGHHAAQPTEANRPALRKTVASYNHRPAVKFDRAAAQHLITPSWASEAQPDTLVFVADTLSPSGAAYFFDGDSGARRWVRRSVSNWSMNGGLGSQTISSSGGANNIPHLFIATFDGVSSSLEVDGVTVASGDAGTHPSTRLILGSRFDLADYLDGHIAMLGRLNGTLTAQDKADILAWSRDYYVTP